MISGVGAYQQQVQNQSSVSAESRVKPSNEVPERDRPKDDVTVSRSRSESLTKANESARSEDNRKSQDLVNARSASESRGTDTAQRRGSLLDITA